MASAGHFAELTKAKVGSASWVLSSPSSLLRRRPKYRTTIADIAENGYRGIDLQ